MRSKRTIILVAVALMAAAVAVAQAAFQERASIQYYRINGPFGPSYIPVGVEGVDYVCLQAPWSTCTYVQVSGTQYIPYKTGQYSPIF